MQGLGPLIFQGSILRQGPSLAAKVWAQALASGRKVAVFHGENQAPGCAVRTRLPFAGELTWGADETLAQLETVLHLYRSGQYLQNSTSNNAGE